MNLEATQPIRVFIDKKYYGQKLEHTQISNIPENRREGMSWKGCYYTIHTGERFKFDRSNNWDVCFFKLGNGAEFKIDCGDPNSFIDDHNISVLK